MKARVSAAHFKELVELHRVAAGPETLMVLADDVIHAQGLRERDRDKFMERLRAIVGDKTVNKALQSGDPLEIKVL